MKMICELLTRSSIVIIDEACHDHFRLFIPYKFPFSRRSMLQNVYGLLALFPASIGAEKARNVGI
jgi:hypothetical protein